MKLVKEHILFGVLNEDETINVLQNTRTNVGYRILDFQIMPNAPADNSASPDTGKSALLTTIPPTALNEFVYDKNTTLGIATFCAGSQANMIDSGTLIVNELYVTNMTRSAGIVNGRTSYQIVLEQYDINSDEQVIAIIRENSQAIE